LTITYSDQTKAFRAFPKATLGCVTLSSDTNVNTGCSKCQPDGLLGSLSYNLYQIYSFNQQFPAQTCQFKSDDGLSTVYCSKQPNGNRPQIVANCYQGAFSADKPLEPMVKF
jgi:hypothetical protein